VTEGMCTKLLRTHNNTDNIIIIINNRSKRESKESGRATFSKGFLLGSYYIKEAYVFMNINITIIAHMSSNVCMYNIISVLLFSGYYCTLSAEFGNKICYSYRRMFTFN